MKTTALRLAALFMLLAPLAALRAGSSPRAVPMGRPTTPVSKLWGRHSARSSLSETQNHEAWVATLPKEYLKTKDKDD